MLIIVCVHPDFYECQFSNFMHLSVINESIFKSISRSLDLAINLSVHQLTFLLLSSVFPSINQSYLLIYLHTRQSISPSISLSIRHRPGSW